MKPKSVLFKNVNIYTAKEKLQNSSMLVNSEGKIEKIGYVERDPDEHIIRNMHNRSILPGFIDVHVHGGLGNHVLDGNYESLNAISRFHAQHGTTSFLATTSTDSHENLIRALENVASSLERELEGAQVLGVHLEGPFIHALRSGAQNKEHIRLPDCKQMTQYIAASNNSIRLVTLAAELEGGRDLVTLALQHGITVSLGHSDATYEQTKEYVKLGVRHTTHHFNGMRPMHHREPGLAGAGLILPELTIELIADGAHVDPALIKYLYETKKAEYICLVTDAVECAGLPDGIYGRRKMIGGKVFLLDGTSLAGSSLTMIQALKNVMSYTGQSLESIVPSLSLVPARQIGISKTKGSLEVGKDADFTIVDEDLTIESTYVKGREVYNRTFNV